MSYPSDVLNAPETEASTAPLTSDEQSWEKELADTDPESSRPGESSSPPSGDKKSVRDRMRKGSEKIKQTAQKARNAIEKGKNLRRNIQRARQAYQAAKIGAAAGSSGTSIAVDEAQQLARQGLIKYLQNKKKQLKKVMPLLLIVGMALFGVFALLIFPTVFFLTLLGGGPGQDEKNRQDAAAAAGTSTLTITKTGPESGSADQYLNYTIHAVSSVPTTNINLVDKIPVNTQYFKAPGGTFKAGAGTDPGSVSWNTKGTANPSDATFTITVRVDHNVQNVRIVNVVTGTSEESVTGTGVVGFIPATSTNCGKYDFSKWPEKNPLGNFGDPLCNYTQAGITSLIKALDPANLHWWYDVIILHETAGTMSPNAFSGLSAAQCKLDCGGAWGLYQMGSSTPPGQKPPAIGKNGIYDRGDVNWEQQTSNAINYNNLVLKPKNCFFWYWRSARDGLIARPPAQPC